MDSENMKNAIHMDLDNFVKTLNDQKSNILSNGKLESFVVKLTGKENEKSLMASLNKFKGLLCMVNYIHTLSHK
jgi:hypothetical protein